MEQKSNFPQNKNEINTQCLGGTYDSYAAESSNEFQTSPIQTFYLPSYSFQPPMYSPYSGFPPPPPFYSVGCIQSTSNFPTFQQSQFHSTPTMWNPCYGSIAPTQEFLSCPHQVEKSNTSDDDNSIHQMERLSLTSDSTRSREVPERITSDLLLFKSVIENHQNFSSPNHQDTGVDNKIKNMSITLFKRLNSELNPYIYILELIYYSSDLMKPYNNIFNQNVSIIFRDWLNKNHTKLLNKEFFKSVINRLIRMNNFPEVKFVCKLFELDQEKELVRDIITNHLSNHHYKEVCPLIIALNLQPCFTLDQVVLPLLFNGQRPIAEQYLQNYPTMQRDLIKMLDDACASYNQLGDFMSGLKFPSPVVSKIDGHFVRKVVGKLIKTFSIPLVDCPNLLQERGFGAINYMMTERFKEHRLSSEAFEEMAVIIVKDNINLQQRLILRLIQQKQMKLALHLAHVLNLNEINWHPILISYAKTVNSNCDNAEVEEVYESTENHLILDIDKSRIQIVDDLEKFMKCIETIEKCDVLGFDAEWRPSFGMNDTCKLALLQLAIWDYVFLLDVLSLTQHLDDSHWIELAKRVFCNSKILKLGFATREDLKMIKEGCFDKRKIDPFSRILDLCLTTKNIFDEYPEIFTYLPVVDEASKKSFESDKGLSKICRIFLGQPLNKNEQMSDWERRPLRKSQVTYAAMDALCLVRVYKKLSQVLKHLDLNIEDLVEEYFKRGAIQSQDELLTKQKHALFEKISQDRRIHYSRPAIPVFKFKFAVDSVLTNLGKELLGSGADVFMLNNCSNENRTIEMILSQNRCFIACGKLYMQLANYLKGGTCFCVNFTLSPQDQFEALCDHFNMKYTKKQCPSAL